MQPSAVSRKRPIQDSRQGGGGGGASKEDTGAETGVKSGMTKGDQDGTSEVEASSP